MPGKHKFIRKFHQFISVVNITTNVWPSMFPSEKEFALFRAPGTI